MGRIDLADPDQRFAAMLQLRVLDVDSRVGDADADAPAAVIEGG